MKCCDDQVLVCVSCGDDFPAKAVQDLYESGYEWGASDMRLRITHALEETELSNYWLDVALDAIEEACRGQ